MKKIGLLAFLLLGTLLLVGCGSKNDVEDVEVVDEVVEEQTLGEAIDEARAELEDCEKGCTEALNDETRVQCIAACQMAKQYADQLKGAYEAAGVEDKTSEEAMDGMTEKEMKAMLEAMQK